MMEVDLDQIEICRMSTRGQIVIPENLRKKLGLEKGTLFIVEESHGESKRKQLLLTVLIKEKEIS